MSEKLLVPGRRRFLSRALPAGALVCLGCKGLGAWPGQASKFAENPGMSTEEAYRFFYGTFVPVLVIMARNIGKEKMVKELMKASAENTAQMITAMAKDLPAKDMKAFAGLMDGMLASAPYNKALTYEVVERSDKIYEVKFTQCLPARIWAEMKAADLGYALECSTGDAMAKAFNPRMKGANPKNILKGDGVCVMRVELA